MIKGTNEGTMTDAEGNYKLNIPATDTNITLVASFIGMESREIKSGPDSNLNFNMEPDNISLDEVVVTGNSTRKNQDLTGAVSVFNEDDDKPAYSEPKPVGGLDAFKDYIQKNQAFPPGHPGNGPGSCHFKIFGRRR